MGELNERAWAVASERGCEAAGLTYSEAIELELRLKAEKTSGLCVITDAAAGRLPPAKKKDEISAGLDADKAPRRSSKRKDAA